jgi:hypothetical protein
MEAACTGGAGAYAEKKQGDEEAARRHRPFRCPFERSHDPMSLASVSRPPLEIVPQCGLGIDRSSSAGVTGTPQPELPTGAQALSVRRTGSSASP